MSAESITLDTYSVLQVVLADRIGVAPITYTSTARLRDNGCIDCNDIAHCHECCETSAKFNGELGPFDLSLLQGRWSVACWTILWEARLTWPLPSSRKTLPKVVLAMDRLRLSTIAAMPIVKEWIRVGVDSNPVNQLNEQTRVE